MMFVYIYIYIYLFTYIQIHFYLYIERERESTINHIVGVGLEAPTILRQNTTIYQLASKIREGDPFQNLPRPKIGEKYIL